MITLPFVDEKSNWDQRQKNIYREDVKNAKGGKKKKISHRFTQISTEVKGERRNGLLQRQLKQNRQFALRSNCLFTNSNFKGGTNNGGRSKYAAVIKFFNFNAFFC